MKIRERRKHHLKELDIAKSRGDPRHSMPAILTGHRCILDVGCGAGQTLIASDLQTGVLAVGIDVDFDALSFGKELTQVIQFANGCAEYLPFRDRTFDLVVARVSLPYTKIPQAIREISRVIKDGGDVWFTLHPISKTIKSLISNLRRLKIRHVLSNLGTLANGVGFHFSGKLFPLPIIKRYESFQTNRSITRVLRRFGFEGISISHERQFIVTAKRHIHEAAFCLLSPT